MTSVMVYNTKHFQSLLRKMSCALWMESCSEIISECIANFFKMCRQRLDSCGLVVVRNFYSSIEKQVECLNSIISIEDMRRNGILFRSIDLLFDSDESYLPSPREIKEQLCS